MVRLAGCHMRHSLTIGIHDIDIARWLFDASKAQNLENPKKQVNRVFAIGQNVRHPELVKDQDADNALAIVEFASGKVLHFHCSRTTMHGHDCVAEVFGTEGRAVVNAVSEALSSIDALSEDWRSRSTGADSRTRF